MARCQRCTAPRSLILCSFFYPQGILVLSRFYQTCPTLPGGRGVPSHLIFWFSNRRNTKLSPLYGSGQR